MTGKSPRGAQSSVGGRRSRLRWEVRRLRRLGRTPRLGAPQPAGDLLAQALERQLTVARLAAGVLGHRRDSIAELAPQQLSLFFGERLRHLHVEDRLDARG